MDTKIVAIAIVAIVAVAAVGTYLVINKDDDNTSFKDEAFNVVSRVNSEGSGLYIKSSVLDSDSGDVPTRNGVAFYSKNGDTYTVSSANASAWGGLVFATPGVTSIQHTQIATLANQMGLSFKQYEANMSKSSDSIYYYTNLSNYSLIVAQTGTIDAGIIWEPQYERVIQESEDFTSLALTNNLFPDHTCCVIIGNHNYIQKNSTNTEKFLAGYVKAVNFVNAALSDKTSTDYAWLLEFTKNKTSGLTQQEIADAFDTITYLYADSNDGSLSKLTSDVASLADNMKSLGNITGKLNDSKALAEAFVDDSYLKKAVSGTYDSSNKATIRVAVITGDIHQIAVHVAIEKGYFDDLGLTVQISEGNNGGAMTTAMQNGSADFAFVGAPPATITTINSGLITV